MLQLASPLSLSERARLWAQVHRAVLHTGEQVVVKVQRPGLQKLFDIDLKPLKRLAQQLDAQEEGRDLTGIYTEYASILQMEIDYISEGRNANRCALTATPHMCIDVASVARWSTPAEQNMNWVDALPTACCSGSSIASTRNRVI